MWELDIKLEGQCFLYSLLLGIALCFLYDIFKAVRQSFKKPHFVATLILDILFFLICVLPVYCHLLIFTNGQVRFYVLFTVATGFFICRFTLSKIFLVVLRFLIGVIMRIFSHLGVFLRNILSPVVKILKKVRFKDKKVLKNT